MSLDVMAGTVTSICFPRVSGDEPHRNALDRERDVFSPRERG